MGTSSNIYVKMKTKPFVHKLCTQLVDKNTLINALFECYQNNAFSTFPYISYGFSSYSSIKRLNSGNCIALALFLKKYLLHNNINSYLIPATIPPSLQKEGYLDLAHVAVAVPSSDKTIYIIDPAFYFLEPIELKESMCNPAEFRMIDILSNSVSNIEYSLTRTLESKQYNQYQSVPKNTYITQCTNKSDPGDYWTYILREISNPDNAVGKFFINIRNLPFIVTTVVEDGLCIKNIRVFIYPNNMISIYKRDDLLYSGPIENIPTLIIDLLNIDLSSHLKYDFKKTLEMSM
jgi:hypothetical protein